MKKFRVLAAALLAAFLVGAVPASAAFDQSVLDGIVLISSGAPDSTGEMSYWRGTGFFVGRQGEDPQYIVTNCHVVEAFILAGKALAAASWPYSSTRTRRKKLTWWTMTTKRTWPF